MSTAYGSSGPNASARTSTATRRCGRPTWILLLVLVLLPIVEIATLVAAGRTIGIWWTLGALVLMSVAGAWMMKREGLSTWRALQDASRSGRMPGKEVADAGLVLVGGFLLLLPGFVTDVIGLLLILPVTRPVARRLLQRSVERRVMADAGVVRSVIVEERRAPGEQGPRQLPHIDLRRD